MREKSVMQVKYINPYTDFGFKKIFGEEASKPLLIDFLNSLLPEKHKIADLSFKNTEQFGQNEYDRKAIYDIYCESPSGEKFIVELQKVKQNFFKDRMVYYATFPIREQSRKGAAWSFELQAIYCIGILDFTFDDEEEEPARSEVVHTVKLKNQNNKVFYENLTFIYLEMPNFNKQEQELNSRLDQWLYFIKHLEDFQSIPNIFKDAIFIQAFESAALAKLTYEDWLMYEMNLNNYRDIKNSLDTARDEGRIEEKIAIAKIMKANHEPIDKIMMYSGLSISDIEQL